MLAVSGLSDRTQQAIARNRRSHATGDRGQQAIARDERDY
jgi:hypothetical protein